MAKYAGPGEFADVTSPHRAVLVRHGDASNGRGPDDSGATQS
ncbi:hypothetical protein [Amycolatopsis sp. cmx-4-61]